MDIKEHKNEMDIKGEPDSIDKYMPYLYGVKKSEVKISDLDDPLWLRQHGIKIPMRNNLDILYRKLPFMGLNRCGVGCGDENADEIDLERMRLNGGLPAVYLTLNGELGLATRCGYLDIIKSLINKGVDGFGRCIEEAWSHGRWNIYNFIKKTYPDKLYKYLNHLAESNSYQDIFFMIDSNTDINEYDGLREACRYGYIAVAELMMTLGAGNLGEGIITALKNNQDEMVKFLINILRVHEKFVENPPPTVKMVRIGYDDELFQIVQRLPIDFMLLHANIANVRIFCNIFGGTIKLACEHGRADIVKLLAECNNRGIDILATCLDKNFIAKSSNKSIKNRKHIYGPSRKVYYMDLREKLDETIMIPNYEENDAYFTGCLMWACRHDKPVLIKFIAQYKSKIFYEYLDLMCEQNGFKIAGTLIKYADININKGFRKACFDNYFNVVSFLIGRGATNLKEGLIIAKRYNYDKIAKYIEYIINIHEKKE